MDKLDFPILEDICDIIADSPTSWKEFSKVWTGPKVKLHTEPGCRSLDKHPARVVDNVIPKNPFARSFELHSLSLVSKRWSAATDRIRFRHIILALTSRQALSRDLARLETQLSRGNIANPNRFGYVRRLELLRNGDDQYGGQHGQNHVCFNHTRFLNADWIDSQRILFAWWFRLDSFMRPISELILRLPNLRDLVCQSSVYFAPCLLRSLREHQYRHPEQQLIRLHLHDPFRFLSLSKVNRKPRAQKAILDRHENAIATTPHLHCIFLSGGFETPLETQYQVQAFRRMFASPNSGLRQLISGFNKSVLMANAIGQSTTTHDQQASGARLRILSILQDCDGLLEFYGVSSSLMHNEVLEKLTDLSISSASGRLLQGLAELARNRELCSLRKLRVRAMAWDPSVRGRAWPHLEDFLQSLDPILNHLDLEGCITNNMFDIVMDRHGPSLRELAIKVFHNVYGMGGHRFVLNSDRARRLSERCSGLHHLIIEIPRSSSDEAETAIYRYLGRLQALEEAHLSLLACSRTGHSMTADAIAIEDGAEPEEPDDYYMPHRWNLDNLSCEDLKKTFGSLAMDEDLALSILSLIKNDRDRDISSPLRRLSLAPVLPSECRNDPQLRSFMNMIGATWEFEMSSRPVWDESQNLITWARTCDVITRWRDVTPCPTGMVDEYNTAWKELWPVDDGKRWWEGWRSLPLQVTQPSSPISGACYSNTPSNSVFGNRQLRKMILGVPYRIIESGGPHYIFL